MHYGAASTAWHKFAILGDALLERFQLLRNVGQYDSVRLSPHPVAKSPCLITAAVVALIVFWLTGGTSARPVEGPVRLGQIASVNGPRVRAERVIEDTRCPADAMCSGWPCDRTSDSVWGRMVQAVRSSAWGARQCCRWQPDTSRGQSASPGNPASRPVAIIPVHLQFPGWAMIGRIGGSGSS